MVSVSGGHCGEYLVILMAALLHHLETHREPIFGKTCWAK